MERLTFPEGDVGFDSVVEQESWVLRNNKSKWIARVGIWTILTVIFVMMAIRQKDVIIVCDGNLEVERKRLWSSDVKKRIIPQKCIEEIVIEYPYGSHSLFSRMYIRVNGDEKCSLGTFVNFNGDVGKQLKKQILFALQGGHDCFYRFEQLVDWWWLLGVLVALWYLCYDVGHLFED